jgi:hypothetical protein
MPASPHHYPVRLTQAQRKVVAEIAPEHHRSSGRLYRGDPEPHPERAGPNL